MPTQDELIQAELDGTIEQLEAKADEQEAEEVTQAQETAEQPAEVTLPEPKKDEAVTVSTDTTTNKQSSVMKLLKQRNEARAELEQLKAQAVNAAELEARIKELEEAKIGRASCRERV